jgi:hypothetical protein
MDKWISVKNRLPVKESGKQYSVDVFMSDGTDIFTGYFNDNGNAITFADYYTSDITHWQPLFALPEAHDD